VNTNKARVLCEYCCKHIRSEIVRCASSEKPIKVTFDLCSDCQLRFQSFNDLAIVYGIAYSLGKEHIRDQIMMRDFAQLSRDLIGRIKTEEKSPIELFEKYKNDLAELSLRATEVSKVYETRYRHIFPLIKLSMVSLRNENPLLWYREFIHRKIKKAYGS